MKQTNFNQKQRGWTVSGVLLLFGILLFMPQHIQGQVTIGTCLLYTSSMTMILTLFSSPETLM